MELLFEFLNHFVGDDTDPIDLLPLVVLAFMLVGLWHIRTLLLQVLVEIGALRERIDLAADIRRLIDTSNKGEP